MAIADIARFDGRHRGRRGFVLGTGMSIAIVLDDLAFPPRNFELEIVVGCKQVHRKCHLNYWVSMDHEFYARDRALLSQAPFIKFVPAAEPCLTDVVHDRNLVVLPHRDDRRAAHAVPGSFVDLCNDADTGVVALRIAYLLGLDPIYVLGLNDEIYRGRLHFHTESRRTISEAEVASMGQDMIPLVQAVVRSGVQVLSCSPISRLNAFIPYVDIRRLEFDGKADR